MPNRTISSVILIECVRWRAGQCLYICNASVCVFPLPTCFLEKLPAEWGALPAEPKLRLCCGVVSSCLAWPPRWARPVTLTMTQPGGRWAAWQSASAAAGAAGPLPAPSVRRVKLSGCKASPRCRGKQTAWDQGQRGCCVGKRRSSRGLRGVGGQALSRAAAVITPPALLPARGRSVGWL